MSRRTVQITLSPLILAMSGGAVTLALSSCGNEGGSDDVTLDDLAGAGGMSVAASGTSAGGSSAGDETGGPGVAGSMPIGGGGATATTAPPDILRDPPGNVACDAAELPNLKLVSIASFADASPIPQIPLRPIAMAQHPEDDGLFVVDREGRVFIVRDGQLLTEPFLEMIESIAPLPSERGLLAMAFHPDYAQNGKFYLSYTRSEDDPVSAALPGMGGKLGDLVIVEGHAQSTNRAGETLTPILLVDQDVRYHNAGNIAFDADGYLVMSVGEDNCEAPCSQSAASPRGGMLRLDVDNLDVPPSGNWVERDGSAHPYVWDKGLRNPWRFSFDLLSGDLYIGDVGEWSWEEIDYKPHGAGPFNYGYPAHEAGVCPGGCLDHDGPIFEYPHGSAGQYCEQDPPKTPDDLATNDEPDCARAVIGGHVYRSASIPELWGRYIFGDQPAGFIHSFIVDGGQATCFVDLTADLTEDVQLTTIVSLGQDASGNVYVIDQGGGLVDGLSQPGAIYRIERE